MIISYITVVCLHQYHYLAFYLFYFFYSVPSAKVAVRLKKGNSLDITQNATWFTNQ